MSCIAIDIVLIPPRKIIDEVIGLNSQCSWSDGNFSQSISDRVPHMTLLMWWIEEENLGKIEDLLNSYAKTITETPIAKSNGIYYSILPDGNFWQYIDIDTNSSLQSIYNYTLTNLMPIMSHIEKREGFIENNTINEITIEWVGGHANKSPNDTYNPHISIGIGTLESDEFKKEFPIESIGIYQLGNYCTCRKLLTSIKLPNYAHI